MHQSNECIENYPCGQTPPPNPLPSGEGISAFTLAEILIALVVIGIVAAITLTTVMPNIQERANSQRQANIVYKVTQATDLMKANGAMVNGFESTDKFVDELQKYLKIMKRCDSEHIADCWPTKKVTTSDGEEFEVSKAKTRINLGFKDDYKDTNNVAIVLADGASLILTYNPANGGIGIGDQTNNSKPIELPVGGKYQSILQYTSNTTGGLAFVMDVNGSKGPNKEKNPTTNKLYDIRALNGAKFAKGCAGTKVGGKCYIIIESPSYLECWGANLANKFCNTKDSYGNTFRLFNDDYWAGAQSDCESVGGKAPTQNELLEICQNTLLRENLGLSDFTGYSGFFWSSELSPYDAKNARDVRFSDCAMHVAQRNWTTPQVLCIGN